METTTFAEIEAEFMDRVRRAVYCSMATVDRLGRPRSRIMHPIWDGPTGWVISRPGSPKARHLQHNPYVSLAYIHDIEKPVYVDALAEWVEDAAEKKRIWELHKRILPPLGFDPEPHYGSIDHPYFGLLRFTPWRITLANLQGESLVWHNPKISWKGHSMSMKTHILAGLREVYARWEELLAGLSEEQILAPDLPGDWSIKDVVAHLYAWQQRSLARSESARLDRPPVFPEWLPGADPEEVADTDPVNAWIYAAHRDKPWREIHLAWKEGFQRFLDSTGGVPERDMLDLGRYPWMEGYSLAVYLIASYDHHQEHLENLETWMKMRQV